MDRSSRPSRNSAGTLPLMSLEASLDEENREVLATLGGPSPRSPPGKIARTRSPYRSMLDVDAPPPRHNSSPGMGTNLTSPRDQRKPSKRLDPGDPSTWTKAAKPVSPSTSADALSSTEPAGEVTSPGIPKIKVESKQDFEQKYNFDMASMPLSGGGLKSSPGQRSREGSNSGLKGFSSERRGSKELRSPPLDNRGNSSNFGLLSTEGLAHKPRSASGSAIDDARRKMSDKSNSFSTMSDDSDKPTRVMQDEEGDEDAVAESSSDEERRNSSSDEESPDSRRGRRRDNDNETSVKDVKEEQSERNNAPQSQGVRSLIEPLMSPSFPKESSGEVHPGSSFGRSGPTAADFSKEDEVDAEIRRAKNMGTSMSEPDDSVPNRHVRMIIRGEWTKFQDDNENNHNNNPRLYLTCTDLSTEASYAMEWTVGTMLRDGDTLLMVYAIEDENAPKEPEGNTQVIDESAKAAQDASDTMETLTRQTTGLKSSPYTKFTPASEAPTATGSVSNLSSKSKREIERLSALDEVTSNFMKLVRRTPLQIRCMIEVIHCQSPKHLILNAIDTLEPTLCVVGTRGRSSLKGVLLGSFSNYLVMKSSVPVMVARRRLKKPHHAKVNSASIKMANNLGGSSATRQRRSLTQARID